MFGSKKECFTMNPDLIEPSFFELYNLLPKTYLNEGQDPSKLAKKIFLPILRWVFGKNGDLVKLWPKF